MAVLEEGLMTYLSTYAGLVTLIGARVYPNQLPQGATLPALVFKRITTPRIQAHDTSGAGTDLAHPRFQFTAWASTDLAAKGVTDQLRAALNGKTGTIATGVTIQGARVLEELVIPDPDPELFMHVSDYEIWNVD